MRKILAGLALTAGGVLAGHLLSLRNKKSRPITTVQAGDMIQWESNGAFVFPEPRKVVNVHDSEMGIYVFVEESNTGIPIDQVVLIKRG